MIIIISRVGHTVNKVMDWIMFHGKKYIRISDLDTLFNLLHIELYNGKLVISIRNEHFDIDLSDVKAIWLWHGEMSFENLSMYEIAEISKKRIIVQNLQAQMRTVYEFIEEYINSKNIIGNPQFQNVNKLTLLRWASELGIDIPHTFVLTKISQFQDFAIKGPVITKSIEESPCITNDKGEIILRGYTREINIPSLNKLGRDEIFPSLVQEKLDKKYEIRIFYLDGKCYPMAIFSQRDKQTAVDFRKYNNSKPNRMFNCRIPEDLQHKIVQLMNRAQLNTGSLDIVKTQDNRYVFLEVNPVGQFGFVADKCNYPLEKIIADKLVAYS